MEKLGMSARKTFFARNLIEWKYLVHNGNMEKVFESLTNIIGKQSDGEKSNSKKSNEAVLNNQLQSATQASVMTSLPSTLASMTSFQPRTLPNFGLPRLDLHQMQAAHQAALNNAGNNPLSPAATNSINQANAAALAMFPAFQQFRGLK